MLVKCYEEFPILKLITLPLILIGLANAQSCIQVQSNYSFSDAEMKNAQKTYGEGVYKAKRGKFEAIRIGMFSSHNSAKEYVALKKPLLKNSIIIDDCTNDSNLGLIGENNTKLTEVIDTIEVENKEENSVILENDKVFKEKPFDNDTFDHYSYSAYFSKLLKEDEDIENSYYSNKLISIEQLIKEDKYNSNLYIEASSQYTEDEALATKERTLESNVALKWEYRLYDGQMSYLYNQVKRISEQGSMIRYEDAKNNLAIVGSDLYANLLFTQTILDIYKDLYVSQTNLFEIIKEKRKKGISSVVDEIDAKNDLLELEKRLFSYEVQHARNTYLVKKSINSQSSKPLYVSPLNVSETNHSEEEERMLIMHNNPDIALAQNELKNRKVEILSEAGRWMPRVDLNAYTGYSVNEDIVNDAKEDGITSGAGITVEIPIYERNDIYLSEEKAKVIALQAKNNLKIAIKNSLDAWDAHKKDIEQLQRVYTILVEQLKDQRRKLAIVRKQFLDGKADYRYYADALNAVSLLSVDLIFNTISQEKRKIFGNYLLGKKIYNVKN